MFKQYTEAKHGCKGHVPIFQKLHVRSNHVQALSTVLRTSTLSYGNMRYSGTCPVATPQPIKMKFYMIDQVGEFTPCTINDWNRLAGLPYRQVKLKYTRKTFITLQPKRPNLLARVPSQLTECQFAECQFAECQLAECQLAECQLA
jgi:hypothetical protein